MPTPIFKIQNVSKVFDRKIVLDDVSLDVNAGEIFGVIGASGSGKSTLLNIMIGFLKPETGDVLFRAEHILEHASSNTFRSVFKHPEDLKKMIGMASQTPSFYLTLSVKENLEYFGALYGLSGESVKANTVTLINLMDLQGSEHKISSNLSGGMQRRLDMACSLIHDPKVLILDEPTADLDPLLRNHIWRLVKKINKRGTTVVLASHHLSELELLCSRIAILRDGKVLAIGTPNEIKERFSKHEEIHLETFPGNYEALINIKDKDVLKEIARIENKGTKIVIFTTKPEIVLHELMKKLEEHNESIIDLRINKPTLDEIFIMVTESQKDIEEEKEEEEEDKVEKTRNAIKSGKLKQPQQLPSTPEKSESAKK